MKTCSGIGVRYISNHISKIRTTNDYSLIYSNTKLQLISWPNATVQTSKHSRPCVDTGRTDYYASLEHQTKCSTSRI